MSISKATRISKNEVSATGPYETRSFPSQLRSGFGFFLIVSVDRNPGEGDAIIMLVLIRMSMPCILFKNRVIHYCRIWLCNKVVEK